MVLNIIHQSMTTSCYIKMPSLKMIYTPQNIKHKCCTWVLKTGLLDSLSLEACWANCCSCGLDKTREERSRIKKRMSSHLITVLKKLDCVKLICWSVFYEDSKTQKTLSLLLYRSVVKWFAQTLCVSWAIVSCLSYLCVKYIVTACSMS